jgi:hypothetical protein
LNKEGHRYYKEQTSIIFNYDLVYAPVLCFYDHFSCRAHKNSGSHSKVQTITFLKSNICLSDLSKANGHLNTTARKIQKDAKKIMQNSLQFPSNLRIQKDAQEIMQKSLQFPSEFHIKRHSAFCCLLEKKTNQQFASPSPSYKSRCQRLTLPR